MKRIVSFILIAILIMALGACSSEEPKNLKDSKVSETQIEKTTEINKGIDNIQEEQRIVSLSPPMYSILCAIGEKDHVVGTSPLTFGNANPKVSAEVNPDFKNIQTEFVSKDFKVNKESLLNLNPSIILLYGKFQDEGLGNLNIPVKILKNQSMDPEGITVFWEQELAQTLNIKNTHKIKNAWEKTHEIVDKLDKNHGLKGLYVFSNMKGIMVSGKDSYGENFMNMLGIENVAKEVEGFKEGAGQFEVSMEQINEWNPDIIFVGRGASSVDMIESNLANQNWSNIEAVKNKRVFDIPTGIFNWSTPCADSPLMPIWMVSCVDSNIINETEMKDMVRQYYKEMYDTELSNETAESIFDYKKWR